MKLEHFKTLFETEAQKLSKRVSEIKAELISVDEEKACSDDSACNLNFEAYLARMNFYLCGVREEVNSIFDYICTPRDNDPRKNEDGRSKVFIELDDLLDVVLDIENCLIFIHDNLSNVQLEKAENTYNDSSVDSYTEFLMGELRFCIETADEILDFICDRSTEEEEIVNE